MQEFTINRLANDARWLRLTQQREISLPRASRAVAAARERVRNTRRMITQSRQLLVRARQAVDSSRLLHVARVRAAETR